MIPGAFQVAQMIKNLGVNAEDARYAGSTSGAGRFPGEGNGNHSSILAWRIPQTEEPGGLLSVGSHRVGHD